MIETWSNNGAIIDLESCSNNSNVLILKVYDKLQDKCVNLPLTKNQLKDLAKFIDRIVQTS